MMSLALIGVLLASQPHEEAWLRVPAPGPWERSAHEALKAHDGFAWYRAFMRLGADAASGPATIELGAIDDADECFVNGVRVGGRGSMPPNPQSAWNESRRYDIPAGTLVEGWNQISIRVHDSGGNGGIHRGPLRLTTAEGVRSLAGSWELRIGDDMAWARSSDIARDAERFVSGDGNAAGVREELVVRGGTVDPHHPTWLAPAEEWTEALPVGNGRTGAMVFGGIEVERIQVNEISLWARSPQGRLRSPAPGLLEKARAMWFAGDIRGCQDLMQREFMSTDLEASHQTAGDVRIHARFGGPITEYRRTLDLDQGEVRTSFRSAEGVTERRTFVTPSSVEMVIRPADPSKRTIVELSRAEVFRGEFVTRPAGDGAVELSIEGTARNGDHHGVRYRTTLRVTAPGGVIAPPRAADGPFASAGIWLTVRDASEIRLRIVTATDFEGGDLDQITASRLNEASAFLSALHAGEAQRWTDEIPTSIRIGNATLDAPIPTLLGRAKSGASTPQETSLLNAYLRFGRHLLRTASRGEPGVNDLPANLQGIWNEHLLAPWNADYHTNINLQMNYWPAEAMGLGSRVDALTDYIDRLARDGATTASRLYGAKGWVCHHTSDAWGMTMPMGLTVWGLWPHGGGWLVRHCWEHYCHTLDERYLRERAFPLMRGASEFYLDWLTVDPATGKLVGGPSSSPENTFVLADGSRADVGMGNAMDQQIVWDCLTNLVDASRVLGLGEDPVVVRAKAALERLAWPSIGEDGRLQEWSRPFREAEPGHRHVSHLYGIYPSAQLLDRSKPAYREAARASLAFRLANGGGHTGWSRAWLINLAARLGDAEAAREHVEKLLAHSTLPNLFDDHPPFQIDGNFGGLAGVCEMLLQSHEMTWEENRPVFAIELLPALPKAWSDGEFTLVARGAILVRCAWDRGELRRVTLTPLSGDGFPERLIVRVPKGRGSPTTQQGCAATMTADGLVLTKLEGPIALSW